MKRSDKCDFIIVNIVINTDKSYRLSSADQILDYNQISDKVESSWRVSLADKIISLVIQS